GQRWGNPHYDWARMQADGFKWWLQRMETQLDLFDVLRIDHFRGFEAYWEIPAEAETAIEGHWVKAPGGELLATISEAFHSLPLVAEDLGVITPEVEALRDEFGLPGMKILQFGFDGTPSNPYLPYNHVPNCVVYTGTHDNDTTLGWFESLDAAHQAAVLDFFGEPAEAMPWPMVRSALASVARLAIVPMQDVLALDGNHRMNRPGTTEGNWQWQFNWDQLPDDLATRLRHLVQIYGRE
ncbi:MAG: 4-alpha-glucanotransferase, partial [Pseudomonadota bacterium]